MMDYRNKFPLSFSFEDSKVVPDEFEDIRKRIVRNALQDFERNKLPGVAYRGPELVERGRSYFFEWTPVGFER